MAKEKIKIVPFEMRFLKDYYWGFNTEITKYQWPDPFGTVDDARKLLLEFLREMERGDTLIYAILTNDDRFVGSVEMHGLSDDIPEIGVWIIESEQRKGYAFEALNKLIDLAREKFEKNEFYYEADIRNEGSMKLLNRLADDYGIAEQQLEEVVTDSGKELKLRVYVLRAK
ncbi:MAG: GNAT family N-acetyltransferase [Lachnospiraceae bacterium]|nr:GNAT family N-acetyltransferase [Lachnospiraceae bacterium]